ncbi:hypothetical protein [Pseudomonas sp. xss_2]|uniref:hypothetical protein n=1 Tax=Pseudomonas sp. xss_2 TaxID=3367215 RepID=UPI00370C25FC
MTSKQEIFTYVFVRNKSDREFLGSIITMYDKNSRWSNVLMRALVLVGGLFLRPRKNTVKCFFWGDKYHEVILGMDKSEICVVGGPKQLRFCVLNGIKFVPCMSYWAKLKKGMLGELNQSDFEDDGKELCDVLGGLAVDGAALVVDNDSLPMQRLLIHSARMAGIKSYCIQHGLFQKSSPHYLLDGAYSDGVFVYDDIQRAVFLEAGIQFSKLHVSGFYKRAYTPSRSLTLGFQGRKICFLGQPWYKYGGEVSAKYLELVSRLIAGLEKLGVVCVYKPHPWEIGAPYLKDINHLFFNGMEAAIEEFDVFFSMTSTALIECGRSGRVSIQVYDDCFKCDNFSELGYCYTLRSDNLLKVEVLEKILTSEPVAVAMGGGGDFLENFRAVIYGVK